MLDQTPAVIPLPANGNGYTPPQSPVLPPKGRKLSSLEKLVEVKFDGDYDGVSVTFHVNPPASFHNEIEALGDHKIYDVLVRVVRTWNITDENEQPLPPTLENFHALPLMFCRQLYDQFWELTRIPKATSGSSSTTSKDEAAASLAGTPSSSTPSASA